jgi:hypothetical protein
MIFSSIKKEGTLKGGHEGRGSDEDRGFFNAV